MFLTPLPFLLFSLSLQVALLAGSKRDEVIQKLTKRVEDLQVKKDKSLDFPYSFYEQKGVYPSYVHLSFRGSVEEQNLRRNLKVFDNNAFVTLWVSSILLEASHFDRGPRPTDTQLMHAIEVIASFHDRNYPSDSSILVFWTQSYNETTGMWYCGPVNLDEVVKYGRKSEVYIKDLLKEMGLEKLWENKIKPLFDELLIASTAFIIPADFDDTFVNFGFGALLKKYTSISQQPYTAWSSNNTKLVSAVNALKRYAYRPFSDKRNTNSIDPRTYFYLRQFLNKYQVMGSPLALATTWIENITESHENYDKQYAMPFGVNNVDITVSTNVIYGLTAAVLYDMEFPETWFDEDVQMIYLNTSNLILYQISHNFSSRPDLALTYYPSVYNFYWFTARTLNLLNSFDQLPYQVMEIVRESLNKTLRGAGTNDILKRATQEEKVAYFDDFLGDADSSIDGKLVNHGDDRIFSTSMALNALFYIWSGHSQIVPTVPETVRSVLTKACHWLTENALSEHFEHMNAFFSGSFKVMEDNPFAYPVNFVQTTNGTILPNQNYTINIGTTVAVTGVIPEDQYQQLLKETHNGFPTPIDFHGYNSEGQFPFPFWSSYSLTYASSILALTQCRAYNISS